jgi:hypothetical protein
MFEFVPAVAGRAIVLTGCREDLQAEVQLAFARLFVSAIIRLSERDPANCGRAAPRLPGRNLQGGFGPA